MVVALRIVCVLSIFCGVLQAAPTVTYDQRQQGEFNLQVDVDDVAIILLPGDEFAQRGILQSSDKIHQIFGRRHGVKSKKKHKKPVNCTAGTTVNPEVPYSELPSTTNSPTSSQGYEELYSTSTSSQEKLLQDVEPSVAASPVSEINVPSVPTDVDGQKIISSSDHISAATSPSAFEKKDDLEETAGSVTVSSSETVAVKTVENPTAVDGENAETNNITEKVAIQTVEKSTEVTKSQASEISNGSKTDVKKIETLSTNFEENPVSVSSNVKTAEKITNDEIIKVDKTPAKDSSTEDKSNEMTTAKILETVEFEEVKPAEMVVIKTMEKPTDGGENKHEEFVDETVVDASRVNGLETQVNTKTTNEPTEMIAMKTLEKPTFAEALKVVKKPMDAADAVKAADTQAGKTTSVDLSKSPVELVAMKTMENPHYAVGPTNAMEKSEITTSTKLVEIQEDKKIQNIPSVENIVSKSAPKQPEMVAMKTVENSSTVKSVISVKTVIKPGIPKSTVSSNSSLIMRKVGDRKPLPTITLEVATPKVL
ncbi:A-kinase anchor protein 200 [Aphis craccivora]|uniref:A-kinase anchor protein 200 n=1 Tax=Aphis craccivora TaxID=307492 RepID=A0A6G0Y717_APHCR|nr:A-kinase anchor protein 200 [Aphis craccivora]